MPASHTHTRLAIAVIVAVAHDEPDFGGWLAHVLAAAAAELGSAVALTAGRPGRHADLVQQLVDGGAAGDDQEARLRR